MNYEPTLMAITKQIKHLPTIFLLILFCGHAQAETKRYDVEILIFEDAHAGYINSEVWREQTTSIDTLSSRKGYYSSIRPHVLTGSYKRIKSSSNYNVLFYGGWRQTGLSKRKAFTISLDQLKNRHNAKSNNIISGDLKLVLARYLHLYGDLNYQRNGFTESRIDYSQNNSHFPISFHSRMRSKELHMVDHPLVGILIQITPVKEKVKEVSAAQPGQETNKTATTVKMTKEISTKKIDQ